MYTLIGGQQSRAMRVIWLLEELGQSYDLIATKPHAPEVLALNPSGKIPVLKTEDAVLTESVAIMTFLADRHDALTFPAGTVDRARQDGHTQFLIDEMDSTLWLAAKHSFVLPEAMRVPAIKPTCRAEFATAQDRLATRLGEGPWLMGETFTIADIIASHCLSWAKIAKFELADGPVTAFLERSRARPAFARAQARR